MLPRRNAGAEPVDSVLAMIGATNGGGALASIIIVNWNVRDLLVACLQSVFDHTRLAHGTFEVIVVDNASRDGSVAAVRERFPQVVCIANDENLGFGRANNQAYELCSGKFVLLLNPDTLVLDNAMGRMLELLEAREDVALVGPRLVYGDGRLQRWTAGRFPSVANAAYHYFGLNYLFGRFGPVSSFYLNWDIDRDIEVDWVSGACMVLRRSAIGSRIFDPAYFMYGEDLDLCHRLKSEGQKILYSPASTIVHYHGRSTRQQTARVSANALSGPRLFYKRSRGARWLVLFDLVAVAGYGFRCAAYGAQGALKMRASENLQSSRSLLSIAVGLLREDLRAFLRNA